jgi:prephenate dehydratase
MQQKKVAFLGPSGTFTEEAAQSNLSLSNYELVPYRTVADVIRATSNCQVDLGIVPIENSTEGSVNTTLDMLTFEADLLIEQEIIAYISHNLLAADKLPISKITKIISHPQAAAQCQKYLAENFADVPIVSASSTAEAAQKVAEIDGLAAAIGTRLAAKIYNLKVIDSNIQDYRDNQTRFVVLGHGQPKPTGHDKTSIVCFIKEDRPGSLLEILQEFASRNINLTKIQSRPTREALGDYFFFIDFEGHYLDSLVAEALKELKKKLRKIKLLGSYPQAKAPSSN